MVLYKGLYFFILTILYFAFYFFEKLNPETDTHIIGLPSRSYFILLFGIVFYYIAIGRFYNVLFDDKNIYYSRLFIKKEIDLKDIFDVSMGILPYKLLIFKAYTITIKTKSGDKIRCLSQELDFNSHTEETREFIELKKKLKNYNTR